MSQEYAELLRQGFDAQNWSAGAQELKRALFRAPRSHAWKLAGAARYEAVPQSGRYSNFGDVDTGLRWLPSARIV